jgi:hypothetical protein
VSWDDDLIPGRDEAEEAKSRKELQREFARIERFVDQVMRKEGLKARRPSSQSRQEEPPSASSSGFLYDSQLLALSQEVLRRRRVPADVRVAAELAPLVISLRSWFDHAFPTWTFAKWMARASAIAPISEARAVTRSERARMGASGKGRRLEQARVRAREIARELKARRPIPRIGEQVKEIGTRIVSEGFMKLGSGTIHELIKDIVHKNARLPGRPRKLTDTRK